MSTLFPRVGKKTLGYNVGEVDAFLATARRAYDHPDARDVDDDSDALDSGDGLAVPRAVSVVEPGDDAVPADTALTAAGIRHTAFAMHKDGYSPDLVDAALERLEDAFAARERDQAARAGGEAEWMAVAEGTAELVVARLSRPRGHRFTRTSLLSAGYRRADVDRFANRLVKYFQDGRELTVDEVRTAVFRPERGGYREAQVDLVLDTVVDVMLAVR